MSKSELKYGLLMFAGFLAFFFTMKSMDLYHNTFLRVFNVVIHISFIALAIKAIGKNADNTGENWLITFLVGFRTGLVGILPFVMFLFTYLKFINPDFMAHIREVAPMGDYLSPFNVALFLLLEGVSVTILSSYLMMRIVFIRKGMKTGIA